MKCQRGLYTYTSDPPQYRCPQCGRMWTEQLRPECTNPPPGEKHYERARRRIEELKKRFDA